MWASDTSVGLPAATLGQVADRWLVPDALVGRMSTRPETAAWLGELPALAEQLADQWGLAPDGAAWSGFLSAVWPVRDVTGALLVLKVVYPDPKTHAEAAGLRAWSGLGTVACLAEDAARNALLLERLDGNASLETYPDVDAACTLIGAILRRLHGVAPPSGVRTVAAESVEVAEQIRTLAARHPGLVPRQLVDRALATLTELQAPHPVWLLHADCHFLNVLRTVDGAGWRAIDPLPTAGPREWELLPILRNRWAAAAATGDPDAALRRRVDQLCEILGADAGYARRLAQAAGVFMLLDLVPTEPTHFFLPSQQLMVHWS